MDLATGVQTIAYFLLAVLVIGAALGVVLLDNIVYSAFLLGGVFVSISGIYILLNADFVSAAQILIYVGAVNVLILFAIMLVNKREDFAPVPRRWIRKGAAGLVASGLFCLLTVMVLQTAWAVPTNTMPTPETIMTIGKHFFTDFLLPFELASVLLLMALVGAVVLARRDYLIDQEPSIGEVPQPPLELPERPREAAILSGKSS